MPEISLKEYFSKLNNLLSERAVDEVLLHCRQILQFYPKNVTAYRYLGRGLVMSGRWEEGRESLRRVLSVIPDDYQAHLALSEANERLGRSDEAIWHLERAFEQRPNDKDIIDALRALYSLHRNINNLKIQLTSAAVARQYARSGAYNQAVDTLRSALSRMNERLDLKLLLAQILQEHGEQEEAAELALEVLGVLPDCLEANRIMAELWLSVNRPSDAQRYVNRLEAVDPYLAVEVAQGYPPEGDTFRLDELDYVRTAQSELASSRLDWLQEIASMPTPAGEVVQEASGDDLTDWASAMLSGRTADEPDEAEEVDEPTSSRFAAMAEEAEEDEAPINFTAMFGQPEPAEADELEAMFAPDTPLDRDDPMAWLHDAGVEIVDTGSDDARYEDLFDDSMPTLEEEDPMGWLRSSAGQGDDDSVVETSSEDDDVDPMAWLRDSGFNPDDEQASAFTEKPADDEEDDSVAWLRDSGMELDDEQDEPVAAMPTDDEDEDPFAWRGNDAGVALEDVLSDTPESEGELEPFDWMQDQALGEEQMLDEALSLDGLTSDDAAAVWEGFAASDSVDAEDDEAFEEFPAEPVVPGARRGLTAMLQEANLDWISKPAGEPAVDDEMDEWLNQFGATSEPQQPVTDNPDWLLELDQPETDNQAFAGGAFDEEAFTLDTGESDSLFAVEAAEEETGMSDEHLHDAEEPEDEDVDWMRDLVAQPDAESDDFEAADDESADADDEEALEEAEMPDWMAALEPESETDSDEAEPVAEEDMSWLADAAPDALDDEESPEEAEMPDWLADLDPDAQPEDADESAEPEPELEAPDMTDFPWMADDAEEAPEPEEDESEAVAAEMPDWMTEMAPDEEAALESEIEEAAEPLAEEDLSWLGDEAEEDAEAVADGDMPDWLSELEPEEADETAEPMMETEPEPELEIEPELEAEPELESEMEPAAEVEQETEPDLEPPDAGDFPWMEGDEEETEQPAAEYEDFPWMGDEAEEAAEEAEAVADGSMPDWLASAELEDEEEQESVIPFNEEALPEPEEAIAESVPNWLADVGADEDEADTEPQIAEDDLSWLDDEEAGEAAAVAEVSPEDDEIEEEPVAEMGDDYDESDDFEPEQEEEYGFLSEADDAFLEAAPAHNAPDWLNAMVPGLDVDYEPGEEDFAEDEEEPIDDETAQREFAWLDNLVEEEMAATKRPDFAFSRLPRWLGSSAASNDDDSDDDFPDWPSDDADADVPEWLR